MSKIIVSIVMSIMLIGITFWVINNKDGIGAGLDQGADNVRKKIIEATK